MRKSLLLCLLLAAFFGGAAHAESSGGLNQFTPPPGDTSVDFLEEVFGSIVGTIHSGGNVEGGETEDVLGSMPSLPIWSTAWLQIASPTPTPCIASQSTMIWISE